MGSPKEVRDNVQVVLDMVQGAQGVALPPAGEAGGPDGPAQEGEGADCTDSSSRPKQAASGGCSAEEQALLGSVREVLQGVKDVTWPVGLTDNRK